MKKIILFMMVSLDGYIEGEGHDLSWHHVDDEFNTFAVEQMKEADTILMGRKTYQLMESYWPTKDGLKDDPVVARLMNNMPKVVISRSMDAVEETDVWRNVRLIRENVAAEIQTLRDGLESTEKQIIVLGSNNLCVTLLENGFLDEIRLMISPVVIGKGTPLFAGIKEKHNFTLENVREFKNGNILLSYTALKKTD